MSESKICELCHVAPQAENASWCERCISSKTQSPTTDRRPQAQVPVAKLPQQLRADAYELSGYGAGNEAEHARQAADEIERLTAALSYLDQQFAAEMTVCPRCANSDPTDGCDSHLFVRETLNHGK